MRRFLWSVCAWPGVFIDNYIALRKVFRFRYSIKMAYYLTNKHLFIKENKNEDYTNSTE